MRTRPSDPGAIPDRRAAPTSTPLRTESVWASLAIALPAIASLSGAIGTVDLAYHLRAGGSMIDDLALARVDAFSFVTAGDPWLDQQWGAQVLLAGVFRGAGFEGLQVLRAVILAASLLSVFLACRARGASVRGASVLTILGGLFLLPAFAIRPQMFGILFLAVTVWILSTRTASPYRVWWLAPVAVAWANTHGSFVLLPLVIGVALFEDGLRHRPLRRLLLAGVVATTATLVNPWGPRVWTYAVDILTDPLIRTIVTEWAPPTATTLIGALFLGSVVAVLLVLARRGEPTAWPDLLWLGLFLLPALGSIRAVAWWGVAVPPVAVSLVGDWSKRPPSQGSRVLNGGLLASLIVGAVILFPWFRAIPLVQAPRDLPARVAGVTEHGARLFVPQPWASWFEFTLPDRRVFVDSRIELYPVSVWEEYFAVRAGRADWADILDRWDVDALVARPGWPLVDFIKADPNWRLASSTAAGLVFVRA